MGKSCKVFLAICIPYNELFSINAKHGLSVFICTDVSGLPITVHLRHHNVRRLSLTNRSEQQVSR